MPTSEKLPHFLSKQVLHNLPAILLCGCLACTSSSGKSFLPGIPGYSEKDKKVFILKKKLIEISGIFYQNDGRLAAMNDEEGKLFLINLLNDSVETYEYGSKADYEDIAKTDSAYYILESNGDLHEIHITPEITTVQYKFDIEKKIEFESLVFYPDLQKLVLISKDAPKLKSIVAYSFDLKTRSFSPQPFFILPMQHVLFKIRDFSADCKPSAAAIQPKTKKLFILASVGKLLLQCTLEGKLEKVFAMNPQQFPQPEGITFASNGDMYISNEGAQGKATIYKFPYIQ